jgi:hypothetical protein
MATPILFLSSFALLTLTTTPLLFLFWLSERLHSSFLPICDMASQHGPAHRNVRLRAIITAASSGAPPGTCVWSAA